MKLSEYREFVPKTFAFATVDTGSSLKMDIYHCLIGIQGEFIEFMMECEKYQEIQCHVTDLGPILLITDPSKSRELSIRYQESHASLLKEIGDICYYTVQLANLLGVPLSDEPAPLEELSLEAVEELGTAIKRRFIYMNPDIDVSDPLQKMWQCIAAICKEYDTYLEQILTMNHTKLAARYPDLVFTTKDSIERKDEVCPDFHHNKKLVLESKIPTMEEFIKAKGDDAKMWIPECNTPRLDKDNLCQEAPQEEISEWSIPGDDSSSEKLSGDDL